MVEKEARNEVPSSERARKTTTGESAVMQKLIGRYQSAGDKAMEQGAYWKAGNKYAKAVELARISGKRAIVEQLAPKAIGAYNATCEDILTWIQKRKEEGMLNGKFDSLIARHYARKAQRDGIRLADKAIVMAREFDRKEDTKSLLEKKEQLEKLKIKP